MLSILKVIISVYFNFLISTSFFGLNESMTTISIMFDQAKARKIPLTAKYRPSVEIVITEQFKYLFFKSSPIAFLNFETLIFKKIYK